MDWQDFHFHVDDPTGVLSGYRPPDRYERLAAVAKREEAHRRDLAIKLRVDHLIEWVECEQISRDTWEKLTYHVPVERATGRTLLTDADIESLGGNDGTT